MDISRLFPLEKSETQDPISRLPLVTKRLHLNRGEYNYVADLLVLIESICHAWVAVFDPYLKNTNSDY